MTVAFREMKYKETLKRRDFKTRKEAGEDIDREVNEFVSSLVASWDYTDVQTGQPVPLGDYGELSTSQYKEFTEAFMAFVDGPENTGVKKEKPAKSANQPKSSSSVIGSRAARKASRPTPQNGSP